MNGAIISGDDLLPNGTIRFLPEAGNNAPVAVTKVTGALYRFDEANGPYPGQYKVVVNLELDYNSLTKMSSSGTKPPPMTWEEKATVHDAAKEALHFDWPQEGAEGNSN